MLGTGTMSRRSGTCRTSSPNSTPRMPGRVGSRVSRCRHGRWVAAITFEAADLPEDVVALVDAHLLDLGGTYGVPEAGDPIQYEELRIEHDQGDVSHPTAWAPWPGGGRAPGPEAGGDAGRARAPAQPRA